MTKNDDISLEMQNQLNEMQLKIDSIKNALHEAKSTRDKYLEKSNLGWLTSITAPEAGTVMAVTSSQEATKWQDIIDRLEKNLAELNTKKRILAWEVNKIEKESLY